MRLSAGIALCAALSAAPMVLSAQETPPEDAFRILSRQPAGPRMTPYLRYQLDLAWRQDEARRKKWEGIRDERELLELQQELRAKLLDMIGGLPAEKTDLHPEITGKIQRDGYSIEKLIFQSLPGVYVTALVYSPLDHAQKHPAVLVPAGHATNGKIHYQGLSQRLARRGYVVIAWDPIGQGERSQFWDAKAAKSRYNLVCAEHAVIGNLAYLAGANLARWEVWDGMRALDYLLTRPGCGCRPDRHYRHQRRGNANSIDCGARPANQGRRSIVLHQFLTDADGESDFCRSGQRPRAGFVWNGFAGSRSRRIAGADVSPAGDGSVRGTGLFPYRRGAEDVS
jgi:hypothetical protein